MTTARHPIRLSCHLQVQLLDTSATLRLPYAMTVLAVSAVCCVIAGIMGIAMGCARGRTRTLYVVLRFFKRREGSYVVDLLRLL